MDDDEVELLLTVTKEYKTKQITKSIDWESCVDKYGEILEAYSAHYPSSEDAAAIGQDFPDKKDELTKSVLTSKLKAIRNKYRQAVNNGRRSGHGRVVIRARTWWWSTSQIPVDFEFWLVDFSSASHLG